MSPRADRSRDVESRASDSTRGRHAARVAGLGVAATVAAGAATGLYAWGIERLRFQLRHVTFPLLPVGSDDLRVLHLSDFHLAPWQTMKHDFVRSLAELEPDLIVNTGDNLGHPDVLPQLREMLAPFRGVPGVYVFGSNDYYGPMFKNPFTYFFERRHDNRKAPRLDVTGLDELLRDDLGWASLNNDAAQLSVAGRQVRFVGVNDPHVGFDRLDEARAAFDGLGRGGGADARGGSGADAGADIAAAGASEGPTGDSALTVGLVHAPYQRILSPLVDWGTDVIFAGHTHGGQVCLPGYGALVTNCDIPRTQVSGPSQWRSGERTAALHISAGLGTSIYAPVRLACPPEATLVTLTAQAA